VVDTPVYPAAARPEADFFGTLKSNDCSDVCASAHHPRNLLHVHSHNTKSICSPAARMVGHVCERPDGNREQPRFAADSAARFFGSLEGREKLELEKFNLML